MENQMNLNQAQGPPTIPGQLPPPSMPIPQPNNFHQFQPSFRTLNPMMPYFTGPQPVPSSAPSTSSSSSTTISLNRSQRCGICDGCKRKACGLCPYCLDSPQFGGPGVKKQSCSERRCLRVLENRLQRDAPSFKARIGCNTCEDCRVPDCRCCLVCLDKKFFSNRYIPGALCAKKRCNNATSLETKERPTKRPCDWSNLEYVSSPKKPSNSDPASIVFHHTQPPQFNFVGKPTEQISIHPHLLMSVPMQANNGHHAINHQIINTIPTIQTIKSSSNEVTCPTSDVYPFSLPNIPNPSFLFSSSSNETIQHEEKVSENNADFKNADALDPFLPPSYASVNKNAVVLQQL